MNYVRLTVLTFAISIGFVGYAQQAAKTRPQVNAAGKELFHQYCSPGLLGAMGGEPEPRARPQAGIAGPAHAKCAALNAALFSGLVSAMIQT